MSEAATWMRNAHIAVYAFMCVCGLCGLCYMFFCAFLGQAFHAIVGAIVAIGGMTIGFMALAAVRIGAVLVTRIERIEVLASRLEEVESAPQSESVTVDLARVGDGDAENLVAANLQHDSFPRLVPSESDTLPEEPAAASPGEAVHCLPQENQWQVAYQSGDIAGCRRALVSLREVLAPERIASMEEGLRAMSRARALQLRQDFARQVRSRYYASALITGKQITELFPDSVMARDFESLCPRLIECASQRKKSHPVSAV